MPFTVGLVGLPMCRLAVLIAISNALASRALAEILGPRSTISTQHPAPSTMILILVPTRCAAKIVLARPTPLAERRHLVADPTLDAGRFVLRPMHNLTIFAAIMRPETKRAGKRVDPRDKDLLARWVVAHARVGRNRGSVRCIAVGSLKDGKGV